MLHAGHPIVFTNNIFGPTIIRTLEPSVPTITNKHHKCRDARLERPLIKKIPSKKKTAS